MSIVLDTIKITILTPIRSWRAVAMFNWNDYCSRRKHSFNCIMEMDHSQMCFVDLK